jgi:hypothetical protein
VDCTAGLKIFIPVSKNFPILIMIAPHGPSPSEKWVSLGIQAAALDLIQHLQELDGEHDIYVLAAERQDRILAQRHGAVPLESTKESFHFGQALVKFIQENDLKRMAYFGAGSAPLTPPELFAEGIDQVLHSEVPLAVVNNLHSTDWAIFNTVAEIQGIAQRLPSDNQIGWVFQNELGYEVRDLPISARSRADIDTPSDLLMLQDHPNLGANLQNYLSIQEMPNQESVTKIRKVMTTPASHLTLIGRTSSHVWQEVERRTQIWTRLFVEERGMIASGRMDRGEVRSLLAEFVTQWGPDTFVDYLGSISDAVLWDTRVWMAHQGGWPSKADRFAADLGRVDEILHGSLKALTEAVNRAPIPILTGGHGVVAGGLLALLESITPG